MTKGLANTKPEPSVSARRRACRQICSNDTASAATAASYRYQARVRELEQRFEVELQACETRSCRSSPASIWKVNDTVKRPSGRQKLDRL